MKLKRIDLRSVAVRHTRVLSAVVVLAGIAGCGTPGGTISYYLPKAETTVKVVQTLACNGAKDQLTQVVSVSATTAYLSDVAAKAVEISPKSMDGIVANADIALAFTDDGRLSGINVTTVGQGGEIVKDVLAIAKAAGVVAVAGNTPPKFDAKKACDLIASQAAKPKEEKPKDGAAKDAKPKADAPAADTSAASVTLAYVGVVSYKPDANGVMHIDGPDPTPISPDAVSISLYGQLAPHIPGLGFYVSAPRSENYEAPVWKDSKADAYITLNTVARTQVQVLGLAGNLSNPSPVVFWEDGVMVPRTGPNDRFKLPLPKAAVFGTRKFTLALTGYGTIGKIEYSSTGGVSEAAGALSAVGSAWAATNKAPTTSQQVTATQAQADLMYQQQRLAACISKPETCTGK